jgi:hypothetical protein
MNRLVYRLLGVGWCVGLLLVAGYGYRTWHPATVPDAGGLDEAVGRIAAEEARFADLKEVEEELSQRVEGKKQVAAEVTAGRLTLLEAAARCRDLDATGGHFNWEGFRKGRGGNSDAERHCREVIDSVRTLLMFEPDRSRAVTERLEAELQDLLQAGTPELPR